MSIQNPMLPLPPWSLALRDQLPPPLSTLLDSQDPRLRAEWIFATLPVYTCRMSKLKVEHYVLGYWICLAAACGWMAWLMWQVTSFLVYQRLRLGDIMANYWILGVTWAFNKSSWLQFPKYYVRSISISRIACDCQMNATETQDNQLLVSCFGTCD